MKKLVEIEVPDGEHCESLDGDSDYCCAYFDMNQDDEHYCQIFNRLLAHDDENQMYAMKRPECLALPNCVIEVVPPCMCRKCKEGKVGLCN